MSERAVLRAQAAYYLASGASPVIAPNAFQLITGPKRDMWLVKTFGLLVGAVGASLAVGASRDEVTIETRVLAYGSGAVLAVTDCWYVARRRIRKTYLIDAVAELAFLAALERARAS